jgi:hypothetical protein
MAHQLVRTLVDPVIEEKVLSLASDSKELGHKEVISAVEAQEMGKRSQGLDSTECPSIGRGRVATHTLPPASSTPQCRVAYHRAKQGPGAPSVGPRAMGPVKLRGRTSAEPWGRTVTNARSQGTMHTAAPAPASQGQ